MTDVRVHASGICESVNVGAGTDVRAFAHVLAGAVIGRDCNICDHVFIENDVVLGDRVTVKSGVQLWDGVELGDDVFIGPNVTFTNDRFPRSKQYLAEYPRTIVEAGASIGGNATILPGVRISTRAMIGAGAVVTNDVPAYAIVTGNPARIAGYVDDTDRRIPNVRLERGSIEMPNGDRSARLIELPRRDDPRGSLVAVELDRDLPFVPRRFFVVFDVPTPDIRGEHAHRQCEQVLVCLRGSVTATIDDGTSRARFLLDSPEIGLFVPAMSWGEQYDYSPDAVLGVFASLAYDADDYIRSYQQFREVLETLDS
jgi:UDP-2-acetamido-3-amino-2,3-dideoxy-glucuronate N-acetyltransferase